VYEPETEPEPAIDPLNTPLRIILDPSENPSLPDTLKLPKGYENLGSLPVLGDKPTAEQLKEALKTKKPDCSALLANYQCGQNDIPSVPSGDIIQPNVGDEIAINSIAFEIVDLDGSGNGRGVVKVPMFNNAKFGVKFENIKVAKGGCVVSGQAILSDVDVALLSEEQRKKLAETYATFNKVLAIADSLAPEIAETYNSVSDFVQKFKQGLSNYVGGAKDAVVMKKQFKAAEKYADLLLKNKNLSDSTRKGLKAAYDEAMATKDFFCSGKECQEGKAEPKKGGPFGEFDYTVSLCEENKAKVLKLQDYLSKGEKEVNDQKCKPFNGITIWGQAEITKNTVMDRGSVKSKIGNAIEYKDCTLLPNYCENDKLVGYTVSLNDKDGRFNRVILQVGENQIEEFKKNYNRLIGASTLYYMNGEPSVGMKKMASVIETGNWSMYWDGLKDEWKDCIRDPVCVATIFLSTANGVLSVTRPKTPPKVSGYKRIEQIRKENNLPTYEERTTVAFVEVEGKEYFGYNSTITTEFQSLSLPIRTKWLNKIDWSSKNYTSLSQAQALSHAESYSLISAFEARGSLPSKIIMYVDRSTCNICRGQLPYVLKGLKVSEVEIFSGGSTKSIIIKAAK
jgi:hypothetical protein